MKNIYAIGKRQWKLGGKNIGEYIARCYDLYETKMGHKWKRYLIKVRPNEGADHAFLCWFTDSLLSKKGLKASLNPTWGADLTIESAGKKICFEIETGKRLDRMKRRDMYARFEEYSKTYDLVFIIVPNERVARRYRGFGKPVITKAKIEAFIHSFFTHSQH